MATTMQEIRNAAEKVGVTPASVYRVHKKTGKPALWCAYFSLSKGFACRPRFTDEQSASYADDRSDFTPSK